MSLIKKILLVSGVILIAIQFIQPSHNKSDRLLSTDISKMFIVPDSVQALLKMACYDCHSSNTNYPWYSNIQPGGWFMSNHIKDAKKELNFSEFGSYSLRRQLSKLDGISNSVRDDIMPLRSYKLMHRQAQLSSNEKRIIYKWTEQLIDSLSSIK